MNNRSPLRKVGQLDNRGSHFYLALYWAQAMKSQKESTELAESFSQLSNELEAHEEAIVQSLNTVQGSSVDLGGYYKLDDSLASEAMRPCALFNQLIDAF